jgi:hypothetical protein
MPVAARRPRSSPILGPATLHVTAPSPLFEGLKQEELVWVSHGDTVTRLAGGFAENGYSTGGADRGRDHRNAAIANETRRQYGLQFHPEVDDTTCGARLLRNFASAFAACLPPLCQVAGHSMAQPGTVWHSSDGAGRPGRVTRNRPPLRRNTARGAAMVLVDDAGLEPATPGM